MTTEPTPERTPPDDTTAPVTAEGLRERVAEALAPWCRVHEITEAPCERCELRLNAVMAALAGDPGDLPARMAEAIGEALNQWSRPDAEGTRGVRRWDFIAAAALSVRLEHAAHLAARVGDAERRAEHAESEHQVTQDRLAEACTQYANLRKAYDDTLALMAEADRTDGGE